MMPAWALLSRVWLDGYEAGCHGRMGWVVAVTSWVDSGCSARLMFEYLERQPHTRHLIAK